MQRKSHRLYSGLQGPTWRLINSLISSPRILWIILECGRNGTHCSLCQKRSSPHCLRLSYALLQVSASMAPSWWALPCPAYFKSQLTSPFPQRCFSPLSHWSNSTILISSFKLIVYLLSPKCEALPGQSFLLFFSLMSSLVPRWMSIT